MGVCPDNYNIAKGVGGGVFPIYYNITKGGEGSTGTPNLYYVINGRPLIGSIACVCQFSRISIQPLAETVIGKVMIEIKESISNALFSVQI